MKRSCAKSSSKPIILYDSMYNSVEKGPMLLAENRLLVRYLPVHAMRVSRANAKRRCFTLLTLALFDKTPQTLMTLMALRQTQPPTCH